MLKDNQAEQAKNFLLKHFPEVEKLVDAEPPKTIAEVGRPLATYAAILREMGNSEDARKLTSRMSLFTEKQLLGNSVKLRGFQYLVLAITGIGRLDDAKVVDYLETAYENGFISNWRYRYSNHPSFISIEKNPRYNALLSRIKDDVARQRDFLPKL